MWWKLVNREVAGTGWNESIHSKIEEFSEEIGRGAGKLVKETLSDLINVCSP
ncbi:COP9 signalosome complex subunit 3 [Iris pallida]|uniref:COP9 signalosome complex subunit 3 n=1 Tax=Iris pallida TaxID=29817 RepID=A0AAX6H692_IRIPA|nr:COP9 signalosome complex subunit 3 [Iris pallida]